MPDTSENLGELALEDHVRQRGSRFGKLVEYPFIKGIEGFPEIIPVIKLEHEKSNFGGVWHSDTSYLEEPPMGTMLNARNAGSTAR